MHIALFIVCLLRSVSEAKRFSSSTDLSSSGSSKILEVDARSSELNKTEKVHRLLMQQTENYFDFSKARPECFLETRDQGVCGNCWALASTRVFAETLCVKTNGGSLMRPSPFQVEDCYPHRKPLKDMRVCTGGYPTYVQKYLSKIGAVPITIYGPHTYTWKRKVRMFFRNSSAPEQKARCRMSKAATNGNNGYMQGDRRIGDADFAVPEKSQVDMPTVLFTNAPATYRIVRPFLSNKNILRAGRLGGFDYNKLTEEPKDEREAWIKRVQRGILERGPATGTLKKLVGTHLYYKKTGHIMSLHGWKRDSSSGKFSWLFKNSWGAGSDEQDILTSMSPNSHGYTHIEDPEDVECRAETCWRLMKVDWLSPALPGTKKQDKFLMPDHRIEVLEKSSKTLTFIGKLGEHNSTDGGLGRGFHDQAHGKWCMYVKFRITAWFTKFQDGTYVQKGEWVTDPQKCTVSAMQQTLDVSSYRSRIHGI